VYSKRNFYTHIKEYIKYSFAGQYGRIILIYPEMLMKGVCITLRKNIFNILILPIVSISLLGLSVTIVMIKKQSKNDIVKIVYVDDIEWASEGGILSGTFVDDKLLSIDINLFRSLFQTNERYYISSDIIFYEKLTYIYNEPMNTATVSFEEEYYIIINNELYIREYDVVKNEEVYIKEDQNNDIISTFIKYKEIIEEKFNN